MALMITKKLKINDNEWTEGGKRTDRNFKAHITHNILHKPNEISNQHHPKKSGLDVVILC